MGTHSYATNHLTSTDNIILVGLFLVHWLVIMYFIFYIPASRTLTNDMSMLLYLDIVYIVLTISVFAHWILLKFECIISYIEKRILYPNYLLGSKPFSNPSLFLGYELSQDNPMFQLINICIWAIIAYNLTIIVTTHLGPGYKHMTTCCIASLFVVFILSFIFLYQSNVRPS